MQLTTILLFALSLQVSATGYAQKVTIAAKDASLKKVVREIRKQTGYYFIYTDEIIRRASPVTLNVKNVDVQEVLNLCFADQPLSYTIDDRIIIVKSRPVIGARPKAPLLPNIVVAPERQIHGIVSDSTTGNPLAGVTVQLKGESSGTATDDRGRFVLVVPDDATLTVSYLGYNSKDIRVGGRTIVNVELSSATTGLNQLVVVGYGTQKKTTLTGSVSTVSGTEVAKSPSPNVGNSLEGRLAGLIVNQRNGIPGEDNPDILVRGISTTPPPGASFDDLLALNAPLVVIDGVPRGADELSHLNPDDIASFSVLKDGSAAIYGARAANGVILVTTKNGTRGKAEFSLSYNYAINSPTKIPDMMDAALYAQVYNEGVFYRTGRDSSTFNPQYTADQIQKMKDGSDPILNPNTDWVGLTLHNSYVKNLNFQVNGGSDKVRYLLSFGSTQQNGNFYGNTMLYKQYNWRAKIDIDLVKNLTVGANIWGTMKSKHYPGTGPNIDWPSLLGANPTVIGKYPNGLIGPGRLNQNILLDDQRGFDNISDNPLFSTFTASYKVPFIEGLKLDASFNYDLRNQTEKNWSTPYYYYEYNTVTGNYDKHENPSLLNAQLTDRRDKWTTMLTNFRVSYDKTFLGNHHIAAMVGWEQQKDDWSYVSGFRKNFLSPAIPQLDVGSSSAEDQGVGGSATTTADNTYFGRVDYDYKSKYLLELLGRYDGSEIFPSNKRYGFFPGVSVGWRLSEENFIREALPFVNELKLRASYGELGNNRVGAFNYLQSYFIGQNYVFGTTDAPGIYSSLLANPDITWERAKKTDFGLEANLWNGKLGIDFTYWLQKRNNILYRRNLSVPAIFGFPTLPYENLGKVSSHGIDLVLSNRGNIGQISYNLSGNVSYNISKAVYLDEVPPSEPYQELTGMPVFTGLYYKADGIFHNQHELDAYPHDPNTQVGDIKILDVNGDSEINAKDQVRLPYTSIPKYIFGLNSNFKFKNFDLNIFFQGQAGVRNYDGQAGTIGGTDFTNGLVWRATDRWTPSNPNGTMPRADAYQPGATTFFFFDASFVRLKTVELGYSIPESVLEKTNFLKSLRVYVSAFNLLTWAAEVDFADPEFNGGFFNYPPSRVINFGASLKF